MKKIVSTILVCVLLVSSLLTLASCGKSLSGEYKAEIDAGFASISTTYEFSAFGKVTKTENNLGKETVTEGKYKINEEGDKITLTFDDESETYDFASYDSYIKIGIVQYDKVD